MDYSRFDHIGDSDEEGDEAPVATPVSVAAPAAAAAAEPSHPGPTRMTSKGKDGRLKFEYQGRTVYEWEQSLEEVNIYICPPPGITKAMLDINIMHRHLSIGLKGTPPFIDEDLGGPVKVGESYWMLSDGEVNINLQKMNKAEVWDRALLGQGGESVDDLTKEDQKKKMMLERFQDEHPGFDFSNAEFNGAIPNAREFMGGVRHR